MSAVASTPVDLASRVIRFYASCVEAEAAMQVRVKQGAPDHIEIESGRSPIHVRCDLPDSQDANRWCAQQAQEGDGGTVFAGWPLVLGVDRDSGSAGTVVSPLLLADVTLSRSEDSWVSAPEFGAVDLNPFALDLFVHDRGERDALMYRVWRTPAVEEARTSEERIGRIIEVLVGAGVEGLAALDPQNLTAVGQEPGVHNSGILMTGSGSNRMTARLLEDLGQMRESPAQITQGPIGMMLGLKPVDAPARLTAHPTVLPSSLAQDRAVASAMGNPFTVVTGPPGTGKSQVLVNTIAAAVCRGEKVLFASKNNQAVDVVFERMALTSSDPCIVRAGAAIMRREVADRISKLLNIAPCETDMRSARDKWEAVKPELDAVYAEASALDDLDRKVSLNESELQRLTERQWALEQQQPQPVTEQLAPAPAEQGPLIDLAPIASVVAHATRLLDELATSPPKRKIGKPLIDEAAEVSLRLTEAMLEFEEWHTAESSRRTVNGAGEGDLAPTPVISTDDETDRQIEAIGLQIVECDERIRGLRQSLTELQTKNALDDKLHAISVPRSAAGRDLLDARWEQVRRSNPEAKEAARNLAQQLAVAHKDFRLKRAHAQLLEALPVLPVWGVTNLSARTNLPLDKGLFDLVIIDEASQCDVASALPLLMRAKRAMIIGDLRQLTHITNISRSREDLMGKRAGLSEDEIAEFSYRGRSCFNLAASRYPCDPIFLDLHFRSHPAIIGFPNGRFYDDAMEYCSSSRPPSGTSAVSWHNVDGQAARGPNNTSFINRAEARETVDQVVAAYRESEGLGVTIGIVTPFKAQHELIQGMLVKSLGPDAAQEITVGTVHRYQGDERDAIFFSPVVAPPYADKMISFAADPNLVNVAMTRAKRRFVVVGNREACVREAGVLADLSAYIGRLDGGGYDSPVEEMLANALRDRGIDSQAGRNVAGHRLDLAVTRGTRMLDIECDGAAFHSDIAHDEMRDEAITNAGWEVMRFSGRRICRDLDGCADEIIAALGNRQQGGDNSPAPTGEADEIVEWPWDSATLSC